MEKPKHAMPNLKPLENILNTLKKDGWVYVGKTVTFPLAIMAFDGHTYYADLSIEIPRRFIGSADNFKVKYLRGRKTIAELNKNE